jgi:hypothetical protein
VLRRAGTVAFAFSSASLLAACGDGGGSAASTTVAERMPPRELGRELRAILGIPTGPAALAGERLDIGVAVALQGEGSTGKSAYLGIELAREHIQAAGGPSLYLHSRDLSGPLPGTGPKAAHIFGRTGVPVALTSLSADHGAMLPAAERYQFLTLDGDTGTGPRLQGKPYFYGLAVSQPEDLFGGAFESMKHRIDERGSTSLVTAGSGADLSARREAYDSVSAQATVPSKGFNVVRAGQSDYSETIAALRRQDPSVILLDLSGFDMASFMIQLADSGRHAPVIGFSWDPDSAKLASRALANFTFVGEYFDTEQPQNEWAKLFASEYRAQYRGQDPDEHVAKGYEDTFIVWELARRVRERGGEIRSGRDYLAALEAEPTFPSLYGAGKRTGSLAVDARTHAPSLRTLGAFEVEPGSSPRRFASFNAGGSDYTELTG